MQGRLYGKIWFVVALFPALLCFGQSPTEQAMRRAADYLVSNQNASGYWGGETGFVGESTIGLCDAYLEMPSAPNRNQYKSSAETAGAYIWSSASYSPSTHTWGVPPYAAEAYALTKLSDISADPSNNQWRTSLVDFFNQVRTRQGGTQGFIDGIISSYGTSQQGAAIYDLSRFAVAAQYVDDVDTGLWRNSIIDLLGEIDIDDDSPVMALGAATWACHMTGGLDDTVITGSSPYFNGKTLAELPDMLAGLQAPDGSFAWSLDGSYPGYTEPTVMATVALDAVGGYETNVENAINALAGGVDAAGACYFKIGDSSSGSGYYYSGETLEAMRPLPVGPLFKRGDSNADGTLDLSDAVFILDYLFAGGAQPPCMDAADSNDDGFVDISDCMKILMYLFGGRPQPPDPFSDCGTDPTDDTLDCTSFPPC